MTITFTDYLDVVNEEDIVNQAAAHDVWLRKYDDKPTPNGWPVYRFMGPYEKVVSFLVDVYGVDEDELDWFLTPDRESTR